MDYYDKYKFFMLGMVVIGVAAYILIKRYLNKKEAQALAELNKQKK